MLTTEQLIAEAWFAWVGHVGADNVEAAAQDFEAKYLGFYANQLAFARELLTTQDVYQTLDDLHHVLPERVNRFVSFDEEAYANSLTEAYYFAPSEAQGVHVFNDK